MKAEDELKELEQNSVSYQEFSNGVEVYTFTHDELARYKKLVAESQLQALKEEVEKLEESLQNGIDSLELSANPDDWILARGLENVKMGVHRTLNLITKLKK